MANLGGDRIGSGLTDSDGSPSGHVEDHVASGLDFLLEQFKTKPRIEGFLQVFLEEVQAIEDALWDLFTKRTLETSEGVQLDGLGQIVGQPRADWTDALYRRFIRVRILVNLSDGRPEQLYSIGLLALQGSPDPVLRLIEQPPKAITIYLDVDISGRDITALEMYQLFFQAKDAGVKLEFIYQLSANGAFTFGNEQAYPEIDTDTGWGDVPGGSLDPTGGDWTSVIG